MPEHQSVTWWIENLKDGDEAAASALWQRYFQRLVGLARQRLGDGQRRVQDEDDIAISVFKSLCEGVERGEFGHLNDRQELWRLLATITVRKAGQQVRLLGRQKRGGGLVRGDSAFLDPEAGGSGEGLDGVAGNDPSPEFLCQLTEEHARLMTLLPDENLRQIAKWKMDGWLNTEIATKLGITTRSVERKIQRIRETWKDELSV